MWQTVLIFPIYIFTKKLETFWFRDFSDTGILEHIASSMYFQVCILLYLYQDQKIIKFELFTKIFELYKVSQIFQYSQIVYI